MTLIFSMILEDVPLLIGDILISSPKPSHRASFIPSVDEKITKMNLHPNYVITNTFQKIIIFDTSFALAYAGDLAAVKILIDEIKKKHNKKPLTGEILSEFFKTNPIMKNTKIFEKNWAIIAYINTHDNKNFKIFSENITTLYNPILGQVFCSGSGTKILESILSKKIKTITGSKVQIDQPQGAMKALFNSLYVMGELWKLDYQKEYNSLKNLFGGGYEIAGFYNGKFQKFTDYLIIIWVIDRKRNYSIRLITKNDYQDGLLVIRVLEGDGRDFIRNRGYVVKSLIDRKRKIDSKTIKKTDLNSHFLLNYFLTQEHDGTLKERLIAIFHQPNMKKYLQIEEPEEQTEIFIVPTNLLMEEIGIILKKNKIII